MPTIIKNDHQILKFLSSIDRRIKRLESLLVDDAMDKEEDKWLYNPTIVALIKKRARQARDQLKRGKTFTLDQLKKELNL